MRCMTPQASWRTSTSRLRYKEATALHTHTARAAVPTDIQQEQSKSSKERSMLKARLKKKVWHWTRRMESRGEANMVKASMGCC